jgi:hypothetical protein
MTFYLRRLMEMYLQKVISKKNLEKNLVFVGILEATDEKSRHFISVMATLKKRYFYLRG